jgi:tRNA(adenine34) deaminase
MGLTVFSDESFMREALKEAEAAFEDGEVPVGAVIVCQNRIIARTHNLTERLKDTTAHAEMQAFTSASHYLGGKYLEDCTLYVTLEPCLMCAGAAFWTQITRVVFGATDDKRGFHLVNSDVFHPKTIVTGGVLAKESADLMKRFFKGKR